MIIHYTDSVLRRARTRSKASIKRRGSYILETDYDTGLRISVHVGSNSKHDPTSVFIDSADPVRVNVRTHNDG